MKKKSKNINSKLPFSRREFIKKTAGATTGLLFSPFFVTKYIKEPRRVSDNSRVVMVKDDSAIPTSVIDENVVQVMMDVGICDLTDIDNVGEAWKSLFPDLTLNSVIGIKVNCINKSLSSHPRVANAIVQGLKRMTVENESFPENNIIIWDRTNRELRNAGYTINTSDTGVRCFGSNQNGVGYSKKSYNIHGSTQKLSRILTESIDYLINLSVLKNHGTAGVTLSMKNHYGTCQQPGHIHGNYCNPFIPALNALSPIRDKQVVCINDALMGIISGGPGGPPQITPQSLILSTDPVALDSIGAQLLEDNGCKSLYRAAYIHSASQEPYNLGIDDPEQIDLVTITSPSVPGSVFLDQTTVTQGEMVKVNWSDWPGKVNIALYKDGTFWMYAVKVTDSSGTLDLDTTDWEIRNDYQIKIMLQANENISQSSSTFSVTSPFSPGSVSLNQTTVTQGEWVKVNWSGWPGKVNIALYKGGTFWIYVAKEADSSGTLNLDTTDWEIRDDYRIKIVLCADENISQFSSTFSVEEPTGETDPTTIEEQNGGKIPKRFRLYQNYPNPFNASTIIAYQLMKSSYVDLGIYNVKGSLLRRMVHQRQNTGFHRLRWDGTNTFGVPVPSGIYIVRLTVDGYSQARKMQLLR